MYFGMGGLEFFQCGAYRMSHFDFHAALAAGDFKGYDRFAIDQRDRVDVGVAIADMSDIRQADVAAIGQWNVECRNAADGAECAEGAEAFHRAADIGTPTRRVHLDAFELHGELAGADPQCRHAKRVEVDTHLAVDTADALEFAHARYAQHGA